MEQPNQASTLLNLNKKSYAHVTSNNSFPTKEQAIAMDSLEGITIGEYVKAVDKLSSPNDIRFVSRILNNRICTYISTKEVGDKLTDTYKQITVNGNQLELRPLMAK